MVEGGGVGIRRVLTTRNAAKISDPKHAKSEQIVAHWNAGFSPGEAVSDSFDCAFQFLEECSAQRLFPSAS